MPKKESTVVTNEDLESIVQKTDEVAKEAKGDKKLPSFEPLAPQKMQVRPPGRRKEGEEGGRKKKKGVLVARRTRRSLQLRDARTNE
jgi:hypothetical protein